MLALERLTGNFQSPLVTFDESIRLSWQLVSDQSDVWQQAYQIQVTKKGSAAPLYDSGMVVSDQSVAISLHKGLLTGGCRYFIRVRCWSTNGEVSPYSESLEILLLHAEKSWQGFFITADTLPGDQEKSHARYLRREYRLAENPIRATASVSALGLYEFFINGKRIGEHYFSPGWTAYQKRVLYQVYDVTAMLQEGSNALGALVGSGWYKGTIGFEGNRNFYGGQTAFFCQINLEFSDGSMMVLGSGNSWKWHESPIVFSEIYDGETYDARVEVAGWNRCGLDDRLWHPVEVLKGKTQLLAPPEGLPVAVDDELPAVAFFRTPKGEAVIDFGQNLTGWVSFRVSGKRGEEVCIRHAEILDADGNFYTKNLRSAKQTVHYILKGEGEEVFHPHFSFQGFRYICLDAYPGAIKLEHFTAWSLHSRFEEIGSFSCSNPLLNQLQHNILWSLKGNFLDIPTDCPQRDERLGWTGDAQIFAPTACFLTDSYAFFQKWLHDLALDQRADGAVSHVVPNVLVEHDLAATYGSSAWGDAAVIVPWTVYLSTSDPDILRQQYPSMKAWVEYISGSATDGLFWEKGFHFGDWVALDAEEGSYYGATSTALIATAYYAYSAGLLAKSAAVLGKDEDARKYDELALRIKQAFRDRFMTEDGVPASRTQTSCVVPLAFGLLEPHEEQATVDMLCTLLDENGGHLNTGFVGTPHICKALSEHGRLSEAYDLLLKEDFPSWLYQVVKGATTIWEHWDGLKTDGSMWSPAMNSFNHYAYGAVGQWLYTVVAGLSIDPERPGYKHVIIRVQIGGGLRAVRASHKGPYGLISLSWERDEETLSFSCTIPPNSSATIQLEGKHILSSTIPLDRFKQEANRLMCEVGSGRHVVLIGLC